MIDRRRFLSLLTIAALRSGGARAGGVAGAVSLTYDDGLDSHLDIAMPALEARGMRGTFYVSQLNIQARLADWQAAAGRGEELANHSVTHPCDLRPFKPSAFAARELAPVEDWLRSLPQQDRVATYAYPCDVTDLGRGGANRQARTYDRELKRENILAARTSEGEPNTAKWLRRHQYRLHALAVGYDAPDVAAVFAYLDRACREGTWAILVFHDLVPAVTQRGQVSIDAHSRILDWVASSPLACAPLGQTFARLKEKRPAPRGAGREQGGN